MDTFSAANQSGLINCIKDIRKKLDPPPVSVCVSVKGGGGEGGEEHTICYLNNVHYFLFYWLPSQSYQLISRSHLKNSPS